MKQEKYKGYTIEARAHRLQRDLGWSSEFDLEKHDGPRTTPIPFILKTTHDSEEDAVASALAHARKTIDEGFTG